jgi:hypothetical protein
MQPLSILAAISPESLGSTGSLSKLLGRWETNTESPSEAGSSEELIGID